MNRSEDERVAAVRRVVEAARTLARPDPTWVAELAESTGLSPAGVTLALDAHLETSPTDAELARLVRSVARAPQAFVVLSANVFVGALRALACAVAASPRVTVKPSRRDPRFARALVGALDDSAVALVEDIDFSRLPPCALHVYGADGTIASLGARVPPHVQLWGHGAGMGVVVFDARAGEGGAAHAVDVARDIVPFDQRGCLSPRLTVIVGSWADGERFAASLAAELARWAADVPVGELSLDERVAHRELRELGAMTGAAFGAEAACVVLVPPSALIAPSPVGRAMVVTVVADDAERDSVVSRWAAHVTTVAVARGERADWMPRGARVALPGAMQRPPLDGPVDLRGAAESSTEGS